MVLVISISDFFSNKNPREGNWVPFSCSNSALVYEFIDNAKIQICYSKVACRVTKMITFDRTNNEMLLIKSNEWIYTLERQEICTLDLEPRALYNKHTIGWNRYWKISWKHSCIKNGVLIQLQKISWNRRCIKEWSANSEIISPDCDT